MITMRPSEKENPGQSGRTLETGAAKVDLRFRYLKNSRFFHKFQVFLRFPLGNALHGLEVRHG